MTITYPSQPDSKPTVWHCMSDEALTDLLRKAAPARTIHIRTICGGTVRDIRRASKSIGTGGEDRRVPHGGSFQDSPVLCERNNRNIQT